MQLALQAGWATAVASSRDRNETGPPGGDPGNSAPRWFGVDDFAHMRWSSVALKMVVLAGLLSIWALTGCSKGPERVPVFPVTGKVLHEGQPAEGAFVVFHPVTPAPIPVPQPRGHVGSDGSFRLSTYDSFDGAPAGEYAVTVEWRKLETPPGEDPRPGHNLVPAEFSNPQQTKLRATVGASPNQIPDFQFTGTASAPPPAARPVYLGE